MITKFKMFENNDSRDESDYIGKLLVLTDDMVDDFRVRTLILLCIRIDFKENGNIFVEFDCFDIYKNDTVSNPIGDHSEFKKDNFDKLDFLSPSDFYNNHKDDCVLLFNEIIEKSNNSRDDLAHWEYKIVESYKSVLLTIPEFEHYASSEKYNL